MVLADPTATINKGHRHNRGIHSRDNDYVINDVYIVGLVGTRMHRLGVMEAQDIRVSPDQNLISDSFYLGDKNRKPSLGRDVFAKFYNIPRFPLFSDVKPLMNRSVVDKLTLKNKYSEFKEEDFFPCKYRKDLDIKEKVHEYFNKNVYFKRVRVTAETFLIEANDRAQKLGKKAYVHVVGLGLGVWRLVNDQHQWYVDTFGQVLKDLDLEHISDINFSWISVPDCCGEMDEGKIKNTKIHISKRDLFDKMKPVDEDKVLVVCWAYDSNSYPGNEYWDGSIQSSGDPQAACSSQVPELHNPLINDKKFRGNNLHIAMKNGTVLNYSDFYNKFVN